MQRRELEALSQLREAQKPIILVFNQIDRYPDADRDLIYDKIKDERIRHLIRPDDVVMTAARPDPFKVKIQLPDGTTTVQWERPAPVIEPLKLRILDVLEREGKALVALNTLLLAGDLHEEIVAHKVRIRDDAANRLIWNFALAKGAAVALNPIPVADMAGGLAVDVGMIVALSKVYGIPLTRRTASSLVKDMMLALGALGAVEVVDPARWPAGVKSSLAGLTILSGGLAVPLTALGYGAIGLAQGATASTTSYVLGQGAKHLPPARVPVGPARDQDRHPPDPRPGQDRLGHRPAPRRPEAASDRMIEAVTARWKADPARDGRRDRRGRSRGLDGDPDSARPRGRGHLHRTVRRGQPSGHRRGRRGSARARYLRIHPLRPADEGGIVGLPRNIHKNFQAWRQGREHLALPDQPRRSRLSIRPRARRLAV